jgi:asparagine synthase (glutamine-hydrolysing)
MIFSLVCGIAGFFSDGRDRERHSILGRMLRSLRHRGPDDEGAHSDPHIALGARRLSVIDLRSGRQPISNEDGTVWVVQNGEIYNYRALRERLQHLGHRFRTASDTEVIAHAYEEYGDEFLSHLDGMFALAVWDAPARTLTLARDRMGEKPLHYFAGRDTFAFGSELRALLEHPDVPRELNLDGLARYLAFEYVPAPHSMMAGVAKLPPGHMLTVSPGAKPRVIAYWDLAFAPETSVGTREWAARVRTELEGAVRRQLVSDVPVGMFLSGGVDSSAIVATAARVSERRLRTFSVGFEETSYDERPFARLVARRFQTEHTEVVFTPGHARALLDEVGRLLDEPLVDGSFLPIALLSGEARRAVTVVLSGDGGDELFCGYPTFLAERGARWAGALPQALQRLAAGAVNRLRPSPRYGSVEFLLRQFFRGLPHPPEVRTQLLLGGLLPEEQARLVAPGLHAGWAGLTPYEDLARVAEAVGLTPLERAIYQHCAFYLAEQNLATVDRASMARGLEVRAPFLDRGMVELTSRIPADRKLRGWTTKYILKEALRGDVPAQILGRRKQGFGVPWGPWLRGPLRRTLEERLAPTRVAHVGLFDPKAVGRLTAEHLAGRRDHRKVLWALMMFDAWREHYLPDARWN